MPELAEVEYFRRKIDPQALGRKIIDIKIKDDFILKTPKKRFRELLLQKKFKSTKRWGKNLFIEFDKKYLLLHFAMSGNVKFYNTNKDEPKYSKIIFNFDDNHSLSIVSIRKFGRVKIVNDYRKFIKKDGICPACETKLKQLKISSRTAYYCPNCQKSV